MSARAGYFLKLSLFVLVAVSILAAISFLAWVNHSDFRSAMIKQVQNQLMFVAKSEAQSIEGQINDITEELQMLSDAVALKRMLSGAQIDETAVDELLGFTYKDISILADTLLVLDPAGRVLKAVPNVENIPAGAVLDYPGVLETIKSSGLRFGRIFKSGTGKQVFSIISPVMGNEGLTGMVVAVISVDRLGELVKHINQMANGYAFLIDRKRSLFAYPDNSGIGRVFADVNSEKIKGGDDSQFRELSENMASGGEGSMIVSLLSSDGKTKIKEIVSYSPVRLKDDSWSLGVVMGYDVIAEPLLRNARDNFIFAGFVIIIFIMLAAAFFHVYKEKLGLEVSSAAVSIINKQLHLEISERKKIEKELQKCLHPGKKFGAGS